jgi:hypothetical protein
MVAMMAGQDAIEELAQEDLGDLRECISVTPSHGAI